MGNNSLTTTKLMKLLKENPDEFIKIQFDEFISLPELLTKLSRQANISKPDLVILTGVSKSYIYQIFKGTFIPGRNMLLKIAIVLKTSVEDTQRLLTLAKQSVLYPKIRRDAALIVCISQKYSLSETNDFLTHIGEDFLV